MWRLLFLAVIWAIWKERNRRSFDGKCAPADVVVDRAKAFVASWVSILSAFRGLPLDIISRQWGKVAFS